MADYLTFLQIQQAVKRAVKQTTGSIDTLIKDAINQVYQLELPLCDPHNACPFWLLRMDDTIRAKAPLVITGISKADPGVVTVDDIGLWLEGDVCSIYSVVGMTEVNRRTFLLGTVSGDTFQLLDLEGNNVDTSSGFTTYSSGGTVHHRGTTLSTNPTEILSARWLDNAQMEKIDHDQVEREERWFGDSKARPTRYMHKMSYFTDGSEKHLLLWFLAADQAYHMRHWYEQKVSPMSADGDIPMLPHEHHAALVSGAVARLAESNVQVELPGAWQAVYEAHTTALQAKNRRYWESHEFNPDLRMIP